MDAGEFTLTIVPPALAILIELLTPLNTRFLNRQAASIVATQIESPSTGSGKEAIRSRQTANTAAVLLENSMSGAVSVAGLWPTVISFAVGFAAIWRTIDDAFWWLFWMTVGALTVGIVVMWQLSKNNLFEVATTRLAPIYILPKHLFSLIIYASNLLIILGAYAVFEGWIGAPS